jgi:alpha-aminoadipate carrier protein LysW
MITVSCIDCDKPIKLPFRPLLGDIISCSHCGAELEVIDVNPVELDWAYLEPDEDEDEEWEWEEDDEDED